MHKFVFGVENEEKCKDINKRMKIDSYNELEKMLCCTQGFVRGEKRMERLKEEAFPAFACWRAPSCLDRLDASACLLESSSSPLWTILDGETVRSSGCAALCGRSPCLGWWGGYRELIHQPHTTTRHRQAIKQR
jgi:hypothetical protein